MLSQHRAGLFLKGSWAVWIYFTAISLDKNDRVFSQSEGSCNVRRNSLFPDIFCNR